MDKRANQRVQFFNLDLKDEIQPIWVFRRTSPESVLGLLIDISTSGVQVLTDKGSPLSGDTFQLTIHCDDELSIALIVNRKWSLAEGTLYHRNGFSIEVEEVRHIPGAEIVIEGQASGKRWHRCELLSLTVSGQDIASDQMQI
jgi:hypothetical protein